MMNKIIKPAYLQGEIIVPSSKSYMQRAIAMAMLSEGTSRIYHRGHCNDSMAALSLIKQLGAKVQESSNEIIIKGGFSPSTPKLDCHESGLCFRMFAPIIALHNKELILTGSGSLIKRPQEIIVDALRQFDVEVETTKGFLPIKIKGPIQTSNATIDASLSSQLLSGLLIALPLAGNNSTIEVKNLKSIPYINMTIDLLDKFGIYVRNIDNKQFIIKGNQKYKACDFKVEGDWSAASFLIAGAMINGEIKIRGLNMNSLQADIAILDLLNRMNANIQLLSDGILVKSSKIEAFDFDATNCPDLFPPLVAIAANANGISKIKGVSRLMHKESNRAIALKTEFKNLGINILINDDYMHIEGGRIKASKVYSHNDHRIAMALTVASLRSKSNITIADTVCVNKSYPNFFFDIEQLSS